MPLPATAPEIVEAIKSAPAGESGALLAARLGVSDRTVKKYRRLGRQERQVAWQSGLARRVEGSLPDALSDMEGLQGLVKRADLALREFHAAMSALREVAIALGQVQDAWPTACRGQRGELRLRFRVFERDSFRCRYCGRSAETAGVELRIDHVVPSAAGGGTQFDNLVTACNECNGGKGDVILEARHRDKLCGSPGRETDELATGIGRD